MWDFGKYACPLYICLSLSDPLETDIVWILGSSFVYWAHRRACVRPVGRDLGLRRYGVVVSWHGFRGLRVDGVQSEIQQLLNYKPRPTIILLHVGANDLTKLKSVQLILNLKSVIDWLLSKLPGLTIIWSHMLYRLRWQGARNLKSRAGS
jgi:hypothetical protein